MKLPTAILPANFQEMRRQSVKPFKRLSGRLLKNVQRRVGRHPLKATPSGSDVKDNKRSKVLLNLLLVRPWILVLGFWLVSMATGTLALSGMLSPRKLTMALPEAALDSATSTQSDALLNANQSKDGAETDAASESAEVSIVDVGSSDTDVTESDSNFSALPIFALVGACAAGSLVISRRRAMVRMAAARAQGRNRKNRSTVTAASATRAARSGAAPVRTATMESKRNGHQPHKKRRQRLRKSVVAAQSAGTGSRVLASRATAQQQKAAQQKKVQRSSPKVGQKVANSTRPSARPVSRVSRSHARRSAVRAASRHQPVVSVVPANESHALDWTHGSLAHQLDVRPQRSAM